MSFSSDKRQRIKKNIKKYWFIIAIIIACILKQLLVSWLPIYARDSAGVDQWKLLADAENILKGQYIALYHAGTLFKRAVTFPLFLAGCNYIGIPYLTGYTLLYTGACLIALITMLYITKRKVVVFLAFLVILFSPTTYDTVVQLVYNLSFTIPLAVWMLSCLMLAYLKREQKLCNIIVWNILAGFSAAAIWLNREDSMWVFPLLLIYIFVMFISYYRKGEDNRFGGTIKRIVIVLIPALMIGVANFAMCCVNYYGYGLFATNDYTDTNFAKAYNSILKVKPDYYPDYCSITRGTLKKIYEISPSMEELAPYIEKAYEEKSMYVTAGRNPEDGEVEDGWMNFFLREAAAKCGYYESAIISDEFWGNVSNEIERAIEEGLIEERNITFFGSVLHHPWRKDAGYMSRWLSSAKDFISCAVFHKIENADVMYNTVGEDIAERYEAMTLGYSVSAPKYAVNSGGWLFCTGLGEAYNIRIVNEYGRVYQDLKWMESKDIRSAYDGKAANLDACRFVMNCAVPYDTDIYIEVVLESGDVYGRVPLKNESGVYEYGLDINGNDATIIYGLDTAPFVELRDLNEEFAWKRVNLVNTVGKIYKKLGGVLAIFSALVYIYVSTVLICTIRTKEYRYLNEWIYMSAIIGCIFILIIALSYIDAFMWGTIWYSSPITALLDYLYGISIICGGNIIMEFGRKKKRNETT